MAGRGNRSALAELLSGKNRAAKLQELEDNGLAVEQGLPDFEPIGLSFREFVDKYVHVLAGRGVWQWTEVSELIAEEFESAEQGKNSRHAITVAPRQGKSILAALFSCHQLLEHNHSVIWISASGKLAQSQALKVLNLLEHIGAPLHPRSKSVIEFRLAYKNSGTFLSKSVTSSIMGSECQTLIIDDPVGTQEAATGALGERFLRAFGSDYLSRLTPAKDGRCASILIHQRLARRDPLGQIMDRETRRNKKGQACMPWRLLWIPYLHVEDPAVMVATAPPHWRVISVEHGEPGTPTNSRITPEFAAEVESGVAPDQFQTLYQGLPDESSELSSWSPEYLRPMALNLLQENAGPRYMALDMALVAGSKNDNHGWSIGCLGTGGLDRKLIILDAGEWSGPVHTTIPAILAKAREWNVSVILCERLSGGVQTLQMLRDMGGLAEYGVTIQGVTPKSRSKFTRYSQNLAPFANGRVYVPEFAEWTDLVNRQAFNVSTRNNRHDDCFDSVLYLTEQLQNNLRGDWTPTEAHWGRGTNTFRDAGIGQAQWGRGSRSTSGTDGQFETDPNQPWVGKAIWDR